tara:strand:- start:1646 stop:2233 length:588 start_codon:yes stop_codon:yes gene_type:complete
MACTALTKGRGLDCSRSLGGVKNIYLGVYDEFDAPTDGTGIVIASSQVTDIEMGTNTLYKYALPKGTGSVTETINGSTEAGTIYYTPSITIQLNKLTKEDQNELKALGQTKLVVFAELNQRLAGTPFNNVILALGVKNGMHLNAGTNASGAAWADRNGYEWTLDGMEQEPMSMVADYTTTPFDNAAFTMGTIVTS